EDDSLHFFCAIDEGIVLTTARRIDLVENLEKMFAEVRSRIGEPAIVLGCDCILRHLECEQQGMIDRVGRIYRDNNVIGFATYGEQYNAMHVNQTFTGVAISRAAP
ncbi:MAG TPA: FIST C-terminal domain-containing protein, partial [Nannocystaceae bacterium]|nr:FIST C-terminal domain-containing protein [Nannocystaceae bacterium]